MTTKCTICGSEFEKKKWNSTYCPGKDCYAVAKRMRQKHLDDLIKSFRKGIKKNFELFEKLLPSKGEASIPLLDAQIKGFDQYAFYKTVKDIKFNLLWYACGPYYFSIINDKGQEQLVIYKN